MTFFKQDCQQTLYVFFKLLNSSSQNVPFINKKKCTRMVRLEPKKRIISLLHVALVLSIEYLHHCGSRLTSITRYLFPSCLSHYRLCLSVDGQPMFYISFRLDLHSLLIEVDGLSHYYLNIPFNTFAFLKAIKCRTNLSSLLLLSLVF